MWKIIYSPFFCSQKEYKSINDFNDIKDHNVLKTASSLPAYERWWFHLLEGFPVLHFQVPPYSSPWIYSTLDEKRERRQKESLQRNLQDKKKQLNKRNSDFTRIKCLLVQHSSFAISVQLFHFDFAPGNVGNSSLHIPELFVHRFYAFV